MWPQSSSNASSLSRSSEINLKHHLAGKSSRHRLWRGKEPLTKCFPLKYRSVDICPLLTLGAQITQWTSLPRYHMCVYSRCKLSSKAIDSWELTKRTKPPKTTTTKNAAKHLTSSSETSSDEQYRLELKFCMKSWSNYNQKKLEEIRYEILAFPWDKIVLQGSSWLMSL